MRSTLLFTIFSCAALAVPLATSPGQSHAVMRAEDALAVRDRETEFVSVDDRQLSPGGVDNIGFNAIIDQVTKALQRTTGLTAEQVKTLVSIVTSILQGRGLDSSVVSKLLSIPSSVLIKLPQILAPILIPATTGIPGINQIVYMLLALLQTLGGGLGLLGGLTGGLGSILGGRSLDVRAFSAISVNDVITKVSDALKGTGISEGSRGIVGNLVRSLLNGNGLGSGAVTHLQSLPAQALSSAIGALNTVIWQVPGLGPLLAPLLVLLQLLLLTGSSGLLGSVNNISGGVVAGKNGPVGGLLGGII
ncbi:hypothetical protein CspeluHIS016_0700660 [Cutaneotrichosporon spelunceum]|uniref:Uncharacterized protein n=1 Tax=Cutaneotrichosporon spelunceum TaxID=1672016 RepID=A0AAD3TY67_9TREE|nr:hypothetical protein CspeluHIS016_0700660 [Cutaneotrichosporon spelunceum]